MKVVCVAVVLVALCSMALSVQAIERAALENHHSLNAAALDPPPIVIGGKTIARQGPAPTLYRPDKQRIADAVVAAALNLPPMATLLGCVDCRSSIQAGQANSAPLPSGGKTFGKYVIVVPGFGSWGPSAAWVTRLAKMSENVILANQYTGTPTLNTLAAVTSVAGVSLPSGLKNVYSVGDPTHRAFLSNEQVSDLVLSYIAQMEGKFGPGSMTSAKITLIGHSQGSFVVTQVKKRLIDAGLPDVIGTVITIGGGLGSVNAQLPGQSGTLLLFNMMNGFNNAIGAPNPDMDAYLKFTQDVAQGKFNSQPYRALVDLGVGSLLGPGSQPYVRPQFRISGASIGIVDFFKDGLFGKPHPESTDGIMPLSLVLAGKKTLQLSTPHDHGYQVEDWHVIDEMVAQL